MDNDRKMKKVQPWRVARIGLLSLFHMGKIQVCIDLPSYLR